MFSSSALSRCATEVSGYFFAVVALLMGAFFLVLSLTLFSGFILMLALAERMAWLREKCLPPRPAAQPRKTSGPL